MEWLERMDRRWKYVLIASLVLLGVIACLIISTNLSRPKSQAPAAAQEYTESEQPPEIFYGYLPVVENSQEVVAQPEVAPSQTPKVMDTQDPNIWTVTNIKKKSLWFGGLWHDVATFKNYSGLEIQGMCMDPEWRTPDVGELYWQNQWGTIILIAQDVKHPTQKFLNLKNLNR
jgi:hypothetical protein